MNPGVPFSTTKALIPLWRMDSSVLAVTIVSAEFFPEVIKRLVPFKT